MSNLLWELIWSAVTVLAGAGVVYVSDKHERLAAALFFAGWTLGSWALLGAFYLLGWWTP